MRPSQTGGSETQRRDLRHEMLSPLSAVFGFLELLREGRGGTLTAQQKVYVECMHEALKEALDKIDATVGELAGRATRAAD